LYLTHAAHDLVSLLFSVCRLHANMAKGTNLLIIIESFQFHPKLIHKNTTASFRNSKSDALMLV
jgi:hypothetical protein